LTGKTMTSPGKRKLSMMPTTRGKYNINTNVRCGD
jgi:hypothetical protein